MRRKVIGIIAGAGLVGVTVTSCVRNDASLIIMGILAPPVSASSGSTSQCVYQPVITGPYISTGVMDLAFTQTYEPALLLGNQLVPAGNASLDRIETNNINVQGAVVTVTDASGASIGPSYTAPASAFLQPSSGGTPGLGVLIVPIISAQNTSAVGAFTGTKRLLSTVYVFGTTSGGTNIQSNQAQFEIDACYGCLVVFPQAADDPTLAKQPNCAATTSSSGGSSITVPCVMGQDQPIDCRLCSRNPVCQ